MSRWVVAGAIGLVGLVAMGAIGAAQEDGPSLPQQMGAINDYAASLGRQTREHLQSQVERLSSEANVDLAVLISLIDPFSDPARYAEAIWRQWDLGSKRSALLVYVREAETRWAFRVLGSSGISDQLSVLRRGEARAAIDDALADRDVAEAVRVGVDALARQWETTTNEHRPNAAANGPDEEAPESAEPESAEARRDARERLPLWAWIAGGLGLLVMVLAVLVWALLTWFCPRCGARLRRRRETPRPWERAGRAGASRSVYYCRNCRYVRRPRRGRRSRRSNRRARGERRRAAGRR